MVPARRLTFRLAALILCAVALFGLAALLLPHSPSELRSIVAGYGWAAPVVFVGLWAAVTPALFSGTILALAAGLLFGPVGGTVIGVAGATLGGLVSFAISRRVAPGAFAALTGSRLKALRRVEERVQEKPFRAILLLRLMPGMPATWLNYAVGLTRVRALPFALASAVGAAPRVFIYAALGGSLAQSGTALRALSLSLMALLAALGAIVVVRERRRVAAAAAG